MFELYPIPETGGSRRNHCDRCTTKSDDLHHWDCGIHSWCMECAEAFSESDECPLCSKQNQRKLEQQTHLLGGGLLCSLLKQDPFHFDMKASKSFESGLSTIPTTSPSVSQVSSLGYDNQPWICSGFPSILTPVSPSSSSSSSPFIDSSPSSSSPSASSCLLSPFFNGVCSKSSSPIAYDDACSEVCMSGDSFMNANCGTDDSSANKECCFLLDTGFNHSSYSGSISNLLCSSFISEVSSEVCIDEPQQCLSTHQCLNTLTSQSNRPFSTHYSSPVSSIVAADPIHPVMVASSNPSNGSCSSSSGSFTRSTSSYGLLNNEMIIQSTSSHHVTMEMSMNECGCPPEISCVSEYHQTSTCQVNSEAMCENVDSTVMYSTSYDIPFSMNYCGDNNNSMNRINNNSSNINHNSNNIMSNSLNSPNHCDSSTPSFFPKKLMRQKCLVGTELAHLQQMCASMASN